MADHSAGAAGGSAAAAGGGSSAFLGSWNINIFILLEGYVTNFVYVDVILYWNK